MNVSANHKLMRFLPFLILIFAISACTLPISGDDGETEAQITGVPVVQLASPLPNASYLEGVAVPIQASISNAGENINRVEFIVDGIVIASQQNPNTTGALVFSLTQTWSSTGVGQHAIVVTAFREDGTASAPATATVNVVDPASIGGTTADDTTDDSNTDTDSGTTGDPQPTNDTSTDTDGDSQQAVAPTNTPQPTNTQQPTAPPAEPTSSVPTGTVQTGVNIRGGPSTNFAVVSTLVPNQTVEVTGLNLDGSWYKVAYNESGSEGWILATLLNVVGSTANLPREAGPPTPVPPPPTAVPATAIPATAVPAASTNLTITQPFIDPPQPQCNQSFTAGMTIQNGGVQSDTGLARIEIVHVASGTIIGSSNDGLVSVNLAPNGTHRVTFTFTIDTYINELQRVDFILDVNSQVAESNESDNRLGVEYTLGQGSC